MTVHPSIIVLTLISALIAATICIGAAFLYGFNGKFMRAIAQMLFAIGLEICIAMIAHFFIGSPIVFAVIKIVGRMVEGTGVILFVRSLVRARASPPPVAMMSGDLPKEYWEERFDRVETMLGELRKVVG